MFRDVLVQSKKDDRTFVLSSQAGFPRVTFSHHVAGIVDDSTIHITVEGKVKESSRDWTRDPLDLSFNTRSLALRRSAEVLRWLAKLLDADAEHIDENPASFSREK